MDGIFCPFLAGTNRKKMLHRVNEQFHILTVIEFTDAGGTKGHRIVREGCGQLVLHIKELGSRDFESTEVKIAALCNDLLFTGRINGFVIVKGAHASIDIVFLPETGPSGMDGNETFQGSFFYDVQFRENSFIAILCVIDKLLDSNEIISGNDRIMQTFPSVLCAVAHVLPRLVVQVAGRVCLASQHIPAISLVSENLENGTRIPDSVPPFGFTPDVCQNFRNFLTGISKEI